MRAFHVGFLKTCNRYTSLLRALREQEAVHKELLDRRPEWISVRSSLLLPTVSWENPFLAHVHPQTPIAPQNEALLEKMRMQIENFHKNKLGCEAQLLDPVFLERCVQYFRFAINWLLKTADPENKGCEILLLSDFTERCMLSC
jgi:hypothetical protein